MTILNFYLILPFTFLVNSTVIFLLVFFYLKNKTFTISSKNLAAYVNFVLFLTGVLFFNIPTSASLMNNLLLITKPSLVYVFITILVSILIFFILPNFENKSIITSNGGGINVELFFIKLVVVCSLLLLSIINDFIVMFFLLELYSISAYILVAYRGETSVFSSEAGVKYFISGTFFSLVLIYGISLLYGFFGTLNLSTLELFLTYNTDNNNTLVQIIFSLILVGLFFKMAVVPFHFWSPDVYEGSPTPTMIFLSIVPKATFILLLIKIYPCYYLVNLDIIYYLAGAASVLVGSLLGVYQKRLKRLLTYSSISSTGFLVLAITGSSVLNISTLTFFLIIYLLTNIGVFILIFSTKTQPSLITIKNIFNLSNLFFIDKTRSIALSFLLFSSAGLPFFIGFLSKFLILFSTVFSLSNFIIFIVLIVSAPLSVFYYIRILKIMSFTKQNYVIFLVPLPFSLSFILSICIVLLVILFLWSDVILNVLTLLFLD